MRANARRPIQRVEFPGSDRSEPGRAITVGSVDPDERITLTVHIKRRSPDKFRPGSTGDLARFARSLTRAALSAQRARTHAAAATRIARFAKANRITLRKVDLPRRRVVLEGSARRLSEIFGATLRTYDDGYQSFRARTGSLLIAKEIMPWTRAILGFDQRPLARNLAGAGSGEGLWPNQLAALYGIPLDRDVSTLCVGIVALGGGHLPSDLALATSQMRQAPPVVVDQSVSGATNSFGGGNSFDQEIALDLQVLAGLLPRARIVVYFAPNTTQSLVDAIHQAVFDDVNRPSVLSLSWGSAEKFWTPAAREATQAALADAARLRVSVVIAAGDELASGGLVDGRAHVWFPASSPYVLGCGGTAITLNGGGMIGAETVWNENFTGTGGGISDIFPVPAYQTHLVLPPSVNDGGVRRGVPDVAAAAARAPGYRIVVGGQATVKDGTSAATPLWAGLIAIANAERANPIGLVNPMLYADSGLCRAITQGDNRVNGKGYDAGPGWNACTGLGVPDGARVVAALSALQAA
jgi:kumamolisin